MSTFDWKRLGLPADARRVLEASPQVIWADSLDQLTPLACGAEMPQDRDGGGEGQPGTEALTAHAAAGAAAGGIHEIRYDVPGRGSVLEATVAKVRNGIVANYVEPYMRRRDPDCMVIADDLPTDKPRYSDRYGGDFEPLRKETLDWLRHQRLIAFGFRAGQPGMGVDGLAIIPANAGFFAAGLALLQGINSAAELQEGFDPRAILYLAPPFRHTHFDGKQIVVHRRSEGTQGEPPMHEMYAYNLYPGPSAKKGVYGVLIHVGEREGWVVPHCAAVQVVTPYDNVVAMMHEGASGGGKSEMLEHAHREPDGRWMLGENLVTGERRHLEISRACELRPVADDMAMAHPSIQDDSGKLRLVDAENAWFVRVNHITHYGVDPHLEKLTAQPPRPLVFLNIDAVPDSRAMIWEPIYDAPDLPCPNPRVILPRDIVPGVVDEPVTIDIRSFGVRTPPCTREAPSFGILGLFHVLPPALAWVWRLVSPRGFANPSIVGPKGEMGSEGVGSYWPFATGRRIPQANLLLEQIRATPRTRYILCPNQHVGCWRVGFMPQWVAREYLARRGNAKFTREQIRPARCPLLGWALYNVQVEGRAVARWFLQVDTQPEVGPDAYDAGAAELYAFFRKHLEAYESEDLDPLGRQIIQCCLDEGTVDDYEALLPQG